MMGYERDTTRYQFKKPGGKIVHRGITDRTLEDRQREHQRDYGNNIRIVKIGPKVCRDSGLRWEREGGKRL
jgi:hypothetical protein